MKRITTVGVGMLLALAAMGLTTATAGATAPEYGRCIKKATKSLPAFSNSGCTLEAKEVKKANYEWVPGAAKRKFKSSGGIGVLTTVGGAGVECKTESSAGEFVEGNNKEEAGVVVKFNGCKATGNPCNTPGAEKEELVTNELDGIVGWENKATKKTDLELYPAASAPNGYFVEFSCLGLVVKVRGRVLVPIKNDKMTSTEILKFVAKAGKQKPEKWEESSEKAILEASFKDGPFEQSGQNITSTITGEEKLELNAVL
jgi:hypothetical protein